ncbi:MAG: peptide-binding protein, partial [Rubrivivax sp.]
MIKPSLTALALLLALAACKEQKPQADYTTPTGPAAYGDVLNTAIVGNPPNLVPYLAADSTASAIAGNIYHALLKYDANLNLAPQLAESYTVAPNNLSITFKLRKGVTFSDGTPLTSADVSATFHALIDPDTKTPYADDYQRVSKFETPDAHTVRVTYAEPFAPSLSSWAGLLVMPAHVIGKTKSFNDTSLKTEPVGTGPYALARWRRGQDVLLAANQTGWQKPYIAQLY